MVHREYEKALEGIKRSYQNSSGVLQKAKLTPVQRHRDHSNERMPMIYREVEENSTGPTGCQQCQEEILEVVPPTNAYGDTHNLLKFYTIGPSQVGFHGGIFDVWIVQKNGNSICSESWTRIVEYKEFTFL